MKYLLPIIILFITSITDSKAQTFEIRARKKATNIIAVDMRCTSGIPPASSDFVTDIVFGLKWQSSYSVDLTNSLTTSYNITKSGVRTLKNGFHFQAFYANNVPFNPASNWVLNDWVEILTVPNTLNGTVPTGTFEICETGFDITTNPSFSTNGNFFTPVINGTATDVVLPVELLFFKGKINETNTIDLTWQTENEQGVQFFEIEHSTTGKLWDKIGQLLANNKGSLNEYQFRDVQKFALGSTHYYRLKIVENEGMAKFSKVISFSFDKTKGDLTLFPNPTQKGIFIKTLNNGVGKVEIIDALGRTLISKEMHIMNGTEYISFENTLTNNGFYTLRFFQNNELIGVKSFVVKQ